jgi:hypothetical protein
MRANQDTDLSPPPSQSSSLSGAGSSFGVPSDDEREESPLAAGDGCGCSACCDHL